MNNGHFISKKDVDICELRKEYNIVENYVENTLPKHGNVRFFLKDVPDSDKEKMKKMYLSGYDSYTIGEVFDMSYKQILKVLDEYNIKRIYSGGKRKYDLNEHYFDCIDEPNKAYILGFLFADGWNDTDKNIISMSLQERDKDILEQISIEIESNKPLVYVNYEHFSDQHNLNACNQYRLVVSSHIMSQALASHGCVKNKSLTLQFPVLRDDLYSHFIRGYFDGDGSLYRSVRNDNKGDNYAVSIVSTEAFVVKARECILNHIDINMGGIYDACNHNGITKCLVFCGRKQTKIIMDWLYSDADLYLKRKHDRYLSYYYENNSLTA